MDIDSFLDKEGKDSASPAPPKEGGQEPELGQEPAGSIDANIQEIKQMMVDKRYEEAERKYIQTKEQFAEMARRHAAEQNRIYTELENINREMVQGLNVLKQEAEKKVSIINELIMRSRDHLAKSELQVSNQLYDQITTMFKTLPDIIADKKLQLEQDITQLHVELSNKTNMAANAEFHTKFTNIRNLLSFATENVRRGNMNDAIQMYNRINTLYEELPKGFLYEKAMLYQQILRLFKSIHHKPAPEPSPAPTQPENQPPPPAKDK
jgi:hypothetical protein